MSNEMWTNKYKPKSIDDCILEAFPAHVQRHFHHMTKVEQLPNMLLYGIAGTGKSTIARILSKREGFDVYEVNGSLLNKEGTKAFSHLSERTIFQEQRVVFIDEADGITTPAQFTLRSMMDQLSHVTWIFTCNYRKRLIEPIASRFMQIECALPKSDKREAHEEGIIRRCQMILNAEGITDVSDAELLEIVKTKYPDIRQTIHEVQLRYSFLAAA